MTIFIESAFILTISVAIFWLTVVETTSSIRLMKSTAYSFIAAIVIQIILQFAFIANFHGKFKVFKRWLKNIWVTIWVLDGLVSHGLSFPATSIFLHKNSNFRNNGILDWWVFQILFQKNAGRDPTGAPKLVLGDGIDWTVWFIFVIYSLFNVYAIPGMNYTI